MYPNVHDFSSNISSFEDTAALMKNLDNIISVDTVTIHLAGTLNIPSYLLIPKFIDWRWFYNTDKTEWYPSVEIIRKHSLHSDWSEIVQECVNRIKANL